LFATDRSLLAAVGEPLPAPGTGRDRGGWLRRWGAPAGALRLPDGRWLVASVPRGHQHPGFPLFLVVAVLALAVGVGAYPVERGVEGEPVAVRGDPRLLRRMTRNLLENARRHGAPPIEVRVNRADGMAELRVSDHGPGIPDAEREDVFRPFHRFAGGGDRGGTGLGLALVRQIARRHGG